MTNWKRYSYLATLWAMGGVMGLGGLPAESRAEALSFRYFDTTIKEPSGAVQLPDGRVLLVEDEGEEVLNLVRITPTGSQVVLALNPEKLFDPKAPEADFRQLDDLEGATADEKGNLYVITSHSRNKKGEEKARRQKLARFTLNQDQLVAPKVVTDLKSSMVETYPFVKAAAEILDVKNDGGLNIEGLAFDPRDHRLWIGFRSPLVDGKAAMVAIGNPDGVFQGTKPDWSPPVLLDLKGEGVRGMGFIPGLKGFLIISGPVAKKDIPFNLWFWSGKPGESARPVKVEGLASLEHAEGITPLQMEGKNQVLIVSDNGSAGKSGSYVVVELERFRIQ